MALTAVTVSGVGQPPVGCRRTRRTARTRQRDCDRTDLDQRRRLRSLSQQVPRPGDLVDGPVYGMEAGVGVPESSPPSGGSSVRHISVAYRHRGANRHAFSGRDRSGGRPGMA